MTGRDRNGIVAPSMSVSLEMLGELVQVHRD